MASILSYTVNRVNQKRLDKRRASASVLTVSTHKIWRQEGKAPFPFIRLGRSVRVPTAAMRAMLGVEAPAA